MMKKIVTFGVFDYFHLGHLRLFKQCKEYGEYLIVAVQDADYICKYKPEATILYTTDERVEILSSIREVDEVIIYDICSVDTLSKIDFDILALGEDHIGARFNEMTRWCEAHMKQVVRLKRTESISSTLIKGTITRTSESVTRNNKGDIL